ncbi:S1C family serine protease [Homoserinimonas sp. OAct 916]|uniref:S1C family serine protease n=1 Tax=Homoserinimonas sp. OAct 916 TaxID=2211450 RepID=UPI000DBE793D|nr:trypsin-like peptidase domain-containing protein [Homoserinimonas sp. OAct 916]
MNATDDANSTRPGTSLRTRGRLAVLSSVAAATMVAGSAFGIGAAFGADTPTPYRPTPYTSSSIATGSQNHPIGDQGQSGFGHIPSLSGGYGASPFGQPSSGAGTSGSDSTPTVAATAVQQVGIVDVVSQLTYDSAEGMATGMVVTSNGEILTNNHVVEGSTSIRVTVVSTGESYKASVVGTDATDDIAVLQLSGASGLQTAAFDSSSNVSVGTAVTAVGNAGGAGGTPSAVTGEVTALGQTITTRAEGSAASEHLSGLIQSNANIQAGDSGGPLYNANNTIIGIDTAAAAGGSTVAGYSIPIASALSIAGHIESGQASAQVTLGYPAFLGVEVVPSAGNSAYGYGNGFSTGGVQAPAVPGAMIGGVFEGTAAANAGLAAGDTITGVSGTAITSPSDLSAALVAYAPGQRVTLTWVDASGVSATATVALGTGPAA